MIGRRRDMMARRAAPSGDLYPVGTDVIDMYIRNQSGFELGQINNSGVFVNTESSPPYEGSNYASGVFIPIDPAYTYTKHHRVSPIAYYAEDNEASFISRGTAYNTTGDAVIDDIPEGARYCRIGTGNATAAAAVTLTRTA